MEGFISRDQYIIKEFESIKQLTFNHPCPMLLSFLDMRGVKIRKRTDVRGRCLKIPSVVFEVLLSDV
jgi:hypothetical protein